MGLLKSQYLPQKPVLFNKVKTFCIPHQVSHITWKYYADLSKNYLGVHFCFFRKDKNS